MGTEIRTLAERKVDGCWQALAYEPFCEREKNYDLYGFLADVRNDAEVPPLAMPRGLPDDSSTPPTGPNGSTNAAT